MNDTLSVLELAGNGIDAGLLTDVNALMKLRATEMRIRAKKSMTVQKK